MDILMDLFIGMAAGFTAHERNDYQKCPYYECPGENPDGRSSHALASDTPTKKGL